MNEGSYVVGMNILVIVKQEKLAWIKIRGMKSEILNIVT